MLIRAALMIVLACVPTAVKPKDTTAQCCRPDAKGVSSKSIKRHIERTAPIQMPGLVNNLRLNTVMVLDVVVDEEGGVDCVAIVSGHPILSSMTLESVREWRFRPYVTNGKRKRSCGRISLLVEANEYGVRYKVL